MRKEFQEHLHKQFPPLAHKKIAVACSGGLDSVVLSYLMRLTGFTITLVHCNFKLRGSESDEDASFVKNLASKWSVGVLIESFNTTQYATDNKCSIQMAARELRYRWFDSLVQEETFDYILTAHHADDALETFMMNLGRGSGLRGLSGIPQQNEHILRPLLPFSRDRILQFAKNEALYWREDSSNDDTKYLRNALRHEVVPAWKEVDTNLLTSFLKTQQFLRDSEALIEDYMTLVYNLVVEEITDGYALDIQKLNELPNTDAILYELLHPFGFTSWEDISDLLSAQSGKQIYSKTHRLLKDRTQLLLTEIPSEAKEPVQISESTTELTEPIHLRFETVSNFEVTNAHTVFVDKDKLEYPLVLRPWRAGDVFQPFGMEGKKKLSKFFKDEKLSLAAKENIWVLCSNGEIVWVVSQRLDDRYKVGRDTEALLKITHIL